MANRKNRKLYDSPLTPQLPIFGTVPIIAHRLNIVFRLSRPRTWVIPSTSFALGYTLAGGGPLYQLGLGIAIAALVTAATNIVNAHADRREDAVNQPTRLFWIERIGPKGAIAASILLYGVASALSIYLGPLYMVILGLGIFNSLFYSLPPLRFKARPLPSLVSFSGAVALPVLSGFSVRGTIDAFNPILWLATYFMFTYGTVKNLPDYSGDRRAGTHTSATIFHNVRAAIIFTGALLTTPYLLLLALATVNSISTTFLLDLIFLPMLAMIFHEMWKFRTPERLEKAHTLGFFYAISFLLFTLVLSSPTLLSLVIVGAAYIWTLLVSKVNVDSRIETRDWEKRRTRE